MGEGSLGEERVEHPVGDPFSSDGGGGHAGVADTNTFIIQQMD